MNIRNYIHDQWNSGKPGSIQGAVRGWERPHCSAVIASADAALVAPTHALLEMESSTGAVLRKYDNRSQPRPQGGQP